MKPWLAITTCIVGAANFLIFGFMLMWLHAIGPDGRPIDSYDAIVTLVTILGLILGALALGLGAAAFFGYQALEAAIQRRTDVQINKRFENLDQFQPPEGSGAKPKAKPKRRAATEPPAQAEEETEI